MFVFDLFCFLFSYVTIFFALIQDAADAEEDRRKKFEAEQAAQKVLRCNKSYNFPSNPQTMSKISALYFSPSNIITPSMFMCAGDRRRDRGGEGSS